MYGPMCLQVSSTEFVVIGQILITIENCRQLLKVKPMKTRKPSVEAGIRLNTICYNT